MVSLTTAETVDDGVGAGGVGAGWTVDTIVCVLIEVCVVTDVCVTGEPPPLPESWICAVTTTFSVFAPGAGQTVPVIHPIADCSSHTLQSSGLSKFNIAPVAGAPAPASKEANEPIAAWVESRFCSTAVVGRLSTGVASPV